MRDVIFHFFGNYQNLRGKRQFLKLSLGQNDGVGSVDVFAIVN